MLTTVAFYESQDPGAAYVGVAAAADPHVFVSGDDIRIPELAQLVAVAAGVASGGQGNARLTSPSLRNVSRFMIEPVNGANDGHVEPDSPAVIIDRRLNPVPLVRGESLNAEIHSDPTAAARQWVLVWLADGPITPVRGAVHTVRATGTTTLVAGAWTACPITFDEALPVGRYDVVGLRARAAGLVAARFVFIGYTWRPGVLGTDTVIDWGSGLFRNGEMGVFGSFENENPPQIECLSNSADTAETFYMDLIKAG